MGFEKKFAESIATAYLSFTRNTKVHKEERCKYNSKGEDPNMEQLPI
jgi:hypothetical protein